MDEPAPGGYPTAVGQAAGTDPVFVGRIREDVSHPQGLDLWVVSDNVRKGRGAEQRADCRTAHRCSPSIAGLSSGGCGRFGKKI